MSCLYAEVIILIMVSMKDIRHLQKFGIWVAKDYVESKDHIEADSPYLIVWAPAYKDDHEPEPEEFGVFGGIVGMGSSEFAVRKDADLFYDALVEYETSGNWEGVVSWVKKGILIVDGLPEEAEIYRKSSE